MDVVQKNNQQSFVWITKAKASYRSTVHDVTLHVGKSNGRELTFLTFRNAAHKKIGAEFVTFGIDGDRLWFAPADNTTGYKLSKGSATSESRYVQCSDSTLLAWTHNHIGDYNLNKDVKSGMYFIDGRRIN